MKRNISIDLLRIICCILVIGIHTTPDYAYSISSGQPIFVNLQALVVQSIVRIGLPVFFMLSGYYLLNRNTDNLFTFYKKRIISLIIPFFIYSIILFYAFSYLDHNDSRFSVYINKLLTSSTSLSVHFWFVYSMLGLYVISPAIKYITDKIQDTDVFKAIIIIVGVFYYSLYSYSASQSFQNYHHLIPLQGIDTWVMYFIVGGLIKRIKISTHTVLSLLPIAFTLHVTTVYFSVNKFGFNIYPYDSGLNILLMSSMVLLIFSRAEFKFSPLKINIIEKLAPLTYGIYLIHPLILSLLERAFHPPFISHYLTLKTISFSILAFFICAFIVFVVDKIITNPILSKIK